MFDLHYPGGSPELRERIRREGGKLASKRSWERRWRRYARHGIGFMVTREELRAASGRAGRKRAARPIAVGARYDRRAGRVVVTLSNGVDVSFPTSAAQGLEHARPAQLSVIEISPSGLGLHWPKLDADLFVPGLLEGALGSRRWMAARLGKRGGQARSEAKSAASRNNGRLGGRPRKSASV